MVKNGVSYLEGVDFLRIENSFSFDLLIVIKIRKQVTEGICL